VSVVSMSVLHSNERILTCYFHALLILSIEFIVFGMFPCNLFMKDFVIYRKNYFLLCCVL
jgi:hypothetical protein